MSENTLPHCLSATVTVTSDREVAALDFTIKTLLLTAAHHLLHLGQLNSAEAKFRAVLAISGDEPQALDGLGLLGLLRGSPGRAPVIASEPTLHRIGVDSAPLNRFLQAERDLRDALDPASGSANRHLRLAHTLRESGDEIAAVSHYQLAAELDPNHVNLVLDVAYSLLSLGKLELSKTHFQNVSNAMRDTRAYSGLGHIARRCGDRVAALGYFEAAAAGDPTNDKIAQEVAAELMALLRFEEAAAAYNRLAALFPEEAGPRLGLAQLAQQRGDTETASLQAEAAVACDPDNAELRVDAGFILLQVSQPDLATAQFAAALDLAPANVRALIGLAHIARQAGDHQTASGHFLSAASQDPRNIGILLDAGFSLLKFGAVKAAATQFEAALALAPEKAEVRLGLAHIAKWEGNTHAALIHLQAALEQETANLDLQLDAGYLLLELGALKDAEALFSAMAAQAPQEPRVLAGLAHVAHRRGEHAIAVQRFDMALLHDPENLSLRLDAASSLLRLDRIEEAVAQLEIATAQAPEEPRLLAALGQVAQHQGDHVTAAVRFEAAAASSPSDFDLRLDAGFSLLQSARFDAAEAHFAAAANLAPFEPRVRAAQGFLARERGDHVLAAEHFRATGELAPHHVEWRVELAAELAALGDTKAASQSLAFALVEQPTNRAALMALGYLTRETGDRNGALILFRRAFEAHPTFHAALLAMAEEQRALGCPDEARASLAAALAAEPDNLYGLMQLAEIAALAAAWDQCLQTARNAIAFHPRRAEAYLEAARALMELGHLDEALAYLDEAVVQAGPVPFIAVRRAEVLRRNGRWQQAHAALDLALPLPAAAFSLWTERLNLFLATGSWETAQQAAAPFPANSAYERALVCHILGTIAEKSWRLHEAAALNRAALAFRPDGAFAHIALGRIGMLLLDMPAALHHQAEASRLEASATLLRGGNVRASQTHVGQILEEFRADDKLVDELKMMLCHPANERISKIMHLAQRTPNHTAPAMQLVIALHQSGLLNWRARKAPWPGQSVPRRIIQYWNDGAPPAGIAALMQQWRDTHSDWEYLCFEDSTAGAFIHTHHGAAVLRAFKQAAEPAQRADLFRLAALKTLGGIYIDADDICLGRLDDVLPMQASLIGYLEHYATLANNFLGATSDQPVISRALDMAVQAVNCGDEDIIWLSTGPGLLTRAFCQALCESGPGLSLLAQCCILETADHSQVALFHAPAPYKATRQHWLRREFERGP